MEGKRKMAQLDKNPPLWRGPDVDVPREIQERGIDPKKYGIDPSRVAKFQVFTNEAKS